MKKSCLQCGKEIVRENLPYYLCVSAWNKTKFCSKSCGLKSHPSNMIGKKQTEYFKKFMSALHKGKKHALGIKRSEEFKENDRLTHLAPRPYRWEKPNKKISYRGIHHWISRTLGKPMTCEHCGETNLKGREIQWANKDHKYMWVATDYLRLCRKCHGLYDKERGLRVRSGKAVF